MTTEVKDLFKHLVHIGHQPSKWNPKMKPYLVSKKNNVHIINLEKTAELLKKAKKFLESPQIKGGKILFVGTKPQISLEVERQVPQTNHFYVNQKWIPGLLTNFTEARKRIDHYLNLKSQFQTREIEKYTKKEVAKFKKELTKLDASFCGVAEMRRKPDAIVVLDAVTERLAIEEAFTIKIPIVAIIDANANPDKIDYPIPGNDDSIKSIHFLLSKLLK